MISKIKEKLKAVKLRRQGFSYGEILKQVPVSKATLSLWLRNISLSKKQKQRLIKKSLVMLSRGAERRRQKRLLIARQIKEVATKEIGRLTKRELWLIGASLYWAEGHKERLRSSSVMLGNSDTKMIKIFLKWLLEICNVSKENIHFWIYLHETAQNRLLDIKKHWSKAVGFPLENFQKVCWKKHKISTKRKNIKEDYYGLLRVVVRKSTNLNRRIQGWIDGIIKYSQIRD